MEIITHSGQIFTVCEYHKLEKKELIYVEWHNICQCDGSKRLGWTKKWVCNQCGLVDDNYK